MKLLTSSKKEKHHQNHLLFYITCTTLLTIIFSLHLISHHTKITINQEFSQRKTPTRSRKEMVESCDLFRGRWVPDPNATVHYTNYTCSTIPLMRNCFLNGRRDKDFLNWKWKPDQCELPRFDAVSFLRILRGKKMAFIGDSLARNQMESLLCLLSTVETPKSIEKDSDDKFTTWEFPKHNFTLAVMWSQFLVAATEISVNGTATGGFRLHLDRVDTRWSENLPTIDYAVFSDAHWFFRQNHLYEDGRAIGCIYCQEPDMADLGPGRAIRMAFRAAFRAINGCKDCKKIVSFLRTYSPAHFEGGAWNAGGSCNRTRPVEREEVNRAGPDWEYRKIQEEEVEMARNEGRGSNEFEILDVTDMMAMRVDGHPDGNSGNRWVKGARDCIHWCLPGPIDTWNGLLLEKIKRLHKMQ